MNKICREIWINALQHTVEIDNLPDSLEKTELEAMNCLTHELLAEMQISSAIKIQTAIRRKIIPLIQSKHENSKRADI